jgi:hypothetical protein
MVLPLAEPAVESRVMEMLSGAIAGEPIGGKPDIDFKSRTALSER